MTMLLLALPLGFVALMLVFAWASHTGRDQRWGEAATRSIGRHPVLIGFCSELPISSWRPSGPLVARPV